MTLTKLVNEHLNPFNETTQLTLDSPQRDLMGVFGLSALGCAVIGRLFFNCSIQNCSYLAAAGTCFSASYLTGKDGYAYLVGLAALGGISHAFIKAIRNDRFFVYLDIDVARILEMFLKNRA